MYDEKFEDELLENSIVSATDYTGLMQIPPTDESEAEAYCDIYEVPEQVNNIARKNRKKGK